MNYAQQRAKELAGEFTRNELLELIAELRLIHAARVVRQSRYYRQPEPKPTPVGPPGPRKQIMISSVSLVAVDGDGVRTESCY